MSKYVRYQPSINRQSDEHISEDHWLKQFEKKLAVQPRSTQQSLFEQINSIMNGSKSKYPSVEAVVDDMKERSGLTAYLEHVKNSEIDSSLTRKTAANKDTQNNKVPIVFQKKPDISHTLDNYIRDTKGNLSVPAIINKLRSIHNNDVSDAKDWEDDNLILEVSKRNLAAKQSNPDSYQNWNNLGSRDTGADSDIDPSNTDAFHALTPAKI
jgi:hypothetical protein